MRTHTRHVPENVLSASLLSGLLALSGVAGAADVPLVLTHQGRLLDQSDAPVNRSASALAFSIWDAPTAGARAWPASGVASCAVDVRSGLFAVRLGDTCGTGLTSAHLPPGQSRWLEVQVDGVALLPRIPVASVPTAVVAARALDSDRLGGVSSADLLDALGHVKVGALAPGSNGQVLTVTSGAVGWGSVALAQDSLRLGGLDPSAYALRAELAAGTIPLAASALVGAVPAASLSGSFTQDLTFAGRIDATGGVRLSDNTGVCDASRAGMIRYRQGRFEGCDGTSWTALAGAAEQTLTFTPPSTVSVSVGSVALTATASSGLPVSYVSETPSVCTISGSSATLLTPGTCTIRATQGGGALSGILYKAAPDVTRSFTVDLSAGPAMRIPSGAAESLVFCRYASDCTGLAGVSSDFSYQFGFDALSGASYRIKAYRITAGSSGWTSGTEVTGLSYSTPSSGTSVSSNTLSASSAGTKVVTVTGLPANEPVFFGLTRMAGSNVDSRESFTDVLAVYTAVGSYNLTVPLATTLKYLVVAGGGGGGGTGVNGGGGGGAGGLLQGSSAVSAGTLAVTVGGGGAAGASGNQGGASSIQNVASAVGGGGGGSNGNAGGSGGSGGGRGRDAGTAGQSNNTAGQGYPGGGAGGGSCSSAGGGGGAGGPGYLGGTDCISSRAGTASVGGPGAAYSVSGVSVTYAGGGGGAFESSAAATAPPGGAGGGGRGSAAAAGVPGVAGTANTGGGGGGGQNGGGGNVPAGAGGSGIVIIRRPAE